MKGYKGAANPWILVALLVVGTILGTAIGETFGAQFPWLKTYKTFNPSLDLDFFKAAFSLKLNLASVLGAAVAWFAYKRI